MSERAEPRVTGSRAQLAVRPVQMLIRLCGLVMVSLGLLFWTGHALFLIPLHLAVGFLLVLALWTLAGLGARAGVHPGFVALVLGWSLLMPALGLTQDRLLVGDAHWVIQLLHLLVGVAAIGQAEGLGARIRQRQQAVA